MYRFIFVAVVASFLLVACKKSESSDSKGEPPPAKASPPKPPECAPGAWKNAAKDHASFCVSLPEGFVLNPAGVTHPKPGVWQYIFVPEYGGADRTTLVVFVERYPKPGVASAMSTLGPNGTLGPKSMITDLEVNVPNGKRIVAHNDGYEKGDERDDEFVALSKGEAAGADNEWVAFCYSSTAKRAPKGDHSPCLSFQIQ